MAQRAAIRSARRTFRRAGLLEASARDLFARAPTDPLPIARPSANRAA
jgi:hypothetical protein